VRRTADSHGVPERVRPNLSRAAAAARLAGAADSEEAVAARMRQAARRSRAIAGGAGRRPPVGGPGSPAPPVTSVGPPAPAPSPATVWPATDGDATVPIPIVAAPSLRRGRPSHPAAADARPGASNQSAQVTTAGAAAAAAALAVAPVPSKREEPSRSRHLTVVPEPGLSPAQRRRRARAALFAGIAAATAVGLALVYLHVVLAQRQFAVDRLNTQVQQAQAAYQQNRLQVAQLGSPDHIISMAEGQLGMIQPGQVTYLTSPPGSTTGTSAGGATAATGAPSTATTAPAGDADWPQIKSELAGLP
jgi:cell division protein FtsB